MATAPKAQRIARSVRPVGALALAVGIADLLSKWAMTTWLGPDARSHEWWVVDGQIGIAYGRNSGAAFGLFQGNAELLAVISVFVAFGLCWLIFAEVQGPVARLLGAGLLLGGAVGNLTERVWHGYVTDFIAVGPWPRFNLADSAITVAVVIFVVAIAFPAEGDAQSSCQGARDIGQSVDTE